MDHKPTRLAADDMGMVAFRDVRLDRYQSVAKPGRSEYHVEFRLRGNTSELFIVQGGPLSGMVDRFLELVALLIGESRFGCITEQAANALFHGLGGELADLLQAGRRNLAEDSHRPINMGNDKQSGMLEGDGPRASNASVSPPLCTTRNEIAPGQDEKWGFDKKGT